jgi:hypothetical protein
MKQFQCVAGTLAVPVPPAAPGFRHYFCPWSVRWAHVQLYICPLPGCLKYFNHGMLFFINKFKLWLFSILQCDRIYRSKKVPMAPENKIQGQKNPKKGEILRNFITLTLSTKLRPKALLVKVFLKTDWHQQVFQNIHKKNL